MSTDILIENEGGSIYGDYASVDSLPELGMFWDKALSKAFGKKVHTVVILYGIEVDKNARGKGYGNDLLGKFLDETKGLPVILSADTAQRQDNGFELVEWYQRHGFKVVGKSRIFPLMLRRQGMNDRIAKQKPR